VLYEFKSVERTLPKADDSTGVPRMVRMMRQRGLPDPEIEERGPLLVVTLRMTVQ
jgi:hypothetical protein